MHILFIKLKFKVFLFIFSSSFPRSYEHMNLIFSCHVHSRKHVQYNAGFDKARYLVWRKPLLVKKEFIYSIEYSKEHRIIYDTL